MNTHVVLLDPNDDEVRQLTVRGRPLTIRVPTRIEPADFLNDIGVADHPTMRVVDYVLVGGFMPDWRTLNGCQDSEPMLVGIYAPEIRAMPGPPRPKKP